MADQLTNDLASLRINRDENRPRRTGVLVRIVVVLGIVGGIAAGGWLAWPYVRAQVFKTKVDVTEISSISPAQASTQLTATGYVVARTLSHVSAKVPGRVSRVHVVEGQTVAAGDVLFELDASDQASAVASARARAAAASARVLSARATITETETQLTRAQTLAASGAGARAAAEDLNARVGSLRAAATAAQAEVRAAQAEVAALQVGEGNFTIRAPIGGTVLTDPVEVGEMVGPEVPMLDLADFSSIVVEIDVPESRLSLVRIGGPCEIVLDAFPGRRFRGQAHEIGRRVNRAKATVPVRVRFVDPLDGVLPDMSARVSFLNAELSPEQLRAAERVVVPARAVVQREGRTAVLTIVDGIVRTRTVRLGEETPEGRVVLDGPPPGTKVVANPPATLTDGVSVEERQSS